MIEEIRPPVEDASTCQTVPPAKPAAEGTVRGVLQEAIQKVMAEIEHHEQEAKRHLQQAEDLRRELQEGFRIVKQEARASARAAAADVGTAVAEPTDSTPTARADAKKKAAVRRSKK